MGQHRYLSRVAALGRCDTRDGSRPGVRHRLLRLLHGRLEFRAARSARARSFARCPALSETMRHFGDTASRRIRRDMSDHRARRGSTERRPSRRLPLPGRIESDVRHRRRARGQYRHRTHDRERHLSDGAVDARRCAVVLHRRHGEHRRRDDRLGGGGTRHRAVGRGSCRALAATVPDSGGAFVLPALQGLGSAARRRIAPRR